MNWSNQDNKKQTGKIDRIYVSPTESYELEHFVTHYLQSERFNVTEKNAKVIRNAIDEYPGAPPVKRDDLTAFLNERFKKK